MDENNPAPRLLSRPGEGIYNDMAGMIEGNSPFQVVWLPDQVRETYLAKVRAKADATKSEGPKSEVRSRMAGRLSGADCVRGERAGGRAGECAAARARWRRLASSRRPPAASGWARPTPSRGRPRRSSSGRAGTTCCWSASATRRCWPCCRSGWSPWPRNTRWGRRASFCATAPRPAPPSASILDRIVQAIPHPITLAKPGDLGEIMKELAAEMKQRAEAAGCRGRPAGVPVHPRPAEIQQAALRGGFRLLDRRRRGRRPIRRRC